MVLIHALLGLIIPLSISFLDLIPILLRDKALDRVFDKTRSMKETSINEQRTTHNYREYRRTKADA